MSVVDFGALGRELSRRVKVCAALPMQPLLRRRRRRLWLLGGFVGASFGDNSAALFRHLRSHRPDIDARYVLRGDSKDLAAARAVGPVVVVNGLRGVLTAARGLAAEVLVVSHGLHDVPGFTSRAARGLRVRLGHGLTAFKKTRPPRGRSADDVAALCDLVPVASEFERENKRAWRLGDAQLVICGVPRFDDLRALAARSTSSPRRLLYMPTWRDWVGPGADDDSSAAIAAFVGSAALHCALDRHEVVLEVYVHRLMHRHLAPKLRGSARVRLLDVDVDVQRHLASAAALITDYSSVTWDILDLDRPALFFQPDLAAYERARGAYFDLRGDLPGPVAHDVDSAVSLVAAELDRGLVLGEAARRWQARAFAFRDDQNCARVVAAIEARLRSRAP